MTSEADRRRLLRIARDAIVAHVRGDAARSMDASGPDALTQCGGAFVTIHVQGDLRGCVGHPDAGQPLPRAVWECAVAACSADPRFEPVTDAELSMLQIEVSLVGPLEPVHSPDEIEIGRHGLVVQQERRRGLLLPQVATEWRWDREAFLAHACRKAGLPQDAWRRGARIWRFEAEVFKDG